MFHAEDLSVRLLNNAIKPALACLPAAGAVEECLACARAAATRLRHDVLRTIGAPDYAAYLAHHAARHPGTPPLAERDYVALFMQRRYGGGAGRCC
jgi:uncharacterized short protein YbdD (DUF466 family)